MLTLTMLTHGSGITSANFEGGGIKTCADIADTGRGEGGNLGKLDNNVLLEHSLMLALALKLRLT